MNNADFTVTCAAFAYYKEMAGGHFINIKNRRHNGLTLVLSGKLKLIYEKDNIITAEAGDIILQRAGDTYRLECADKLGTEYIVISYIAESDTDFSKLLPERLFRTEHFRRYRDAFEEAARVFAGEGMCRSALLRALVQEILCDIIRESHPTSLLTAADPASAAKYYIDEYFERTITADDLAAVSGICASHLRVVFKRTYGETPNRYLNSVRVKHAKEMLASGMFSLEEVAENCGFRNVYYFSRVFREYTGTTPGRY